jgi:iron complex outermembrane recepter protein
MLWGRGIGFQGIIMARSRLGTGAGTLLLALGMLAGETLPAQQAPEQPAAPATSLETVIVTGSLIKREDFDTPSPVQVMSAEELKDTGYTSISEVLRGLSANGQGTLTQTNPFSFAGGASGVALRGLTVGATLTLVDGERMVAYPLTDDGQRSFVDINSIPFSVVDRVEVLKDGASAEYGSDAIAGVVNVILKKSFTGFEINAEGGESGRHDGATEHVNAIAGIGKLDSDGYNAYLSVEWRHQDEIYLDDRHGLWTNLDWIPFGGVNLRPGAGSAYNAQVVAYPASLTGYLVNPNTLAVDGSEIFVNNACNNTKLFNDECTYTDKRLQIQPQTGNLNVLGRFTENLAGGWQAIVTASLFRSEAEQIGGHAVLNPDTLPNVALEPGGTPTIVNSSLFPLTVPTNYPGNTFGQPAPLVYEFPELGQITTQFVTDTYRLFTDFRGSWAGWDLDATAGAMYAAVTQTGSAGLNFVALQNALNKDYVLGSADGAALFAPPEEVKDTNSLQDIDLRGTRPLAQLPGGALTLGAGLDYNHRYLYSLLPPEVADGAQTPSIAFAYALGSQTDYAGYTELVAPVFTSLELDGAVRWDHYNTYGSSTTPKFGLKYTPFRQLTFRGTWGEGFRAPNPAEAGTAGNLFLSEVFPDPVLCKQNAQGQQLPGSFPLTCSLAPTGLQTTNPNLKPERSTNYTFGVIATPIEQIKLSVDYWDIKIKQDVVSASELVNLGVPAQSLQFTIVRGPQVILPQVQPNGTLVNELTPVGLIDFQAFPYVNATQTEVNGIDVDLASHVDIGKAGKLSATLNYTHMFHYYLSAPGVPTTDLAGTHGPSGVSGDTGNPKDRAVLSLSWDRGPWDVTGTVNYIGKFDLTDPSIGIDTCGESIIGSGKWVGVYNGPASFCQVDRFVDVDLYAEYTFGDHFRVHGAILNVFDKPPPLDMQTYGSAGNYSNAFHDAGAIGRFFNIGATYTF